MTRRGRPRWTGTRGSLRLVLAAALVSALCAACGGPAEVEGAGRPAGPAGQSRAGQPQAGQPQVGRARVGQPQVGQPQVGQPRVVATVVRSPRVRDLRIASPALGRTATVRLLLPAAYDARPNRRWPVLYLLHGCCDGYQSWTRSTDVEQLTARSDVLVVMPEGGKAGFYSDWVAGRPRWETFHLTELRRILEVQYRAGTAWAIGGLSMGGLGALDYAARHPGLFRAAASFSGVVHTRLSPAESEIYLRLLGSEGEHRLGLWGDPHTQAAVWAAHNPYDLAPRLRGTALFVSVGTGRPGPLDPPGAAFDTLESDLAAENAAFADRLRTLHIPVRLDFYGPGTHIWPYWRRELHRAWPMFQRALRVH